MIFLIGVQTLLIQYYRKQRYAWNDGINRTLGEKHRYGKVCTTMHIKPYAEKK